MLSLRSIAACSLVLVLAACGGGGGGGGSTTSGGGNVNPPTPNGANMTQQSVQRADVQSSLAGVQAVREYSGGSGTTALFKQRQALKTAMMQARRAGMFATATVVRPQASPTSAPGCSNGTVTGTPVSGPNGSVIITLSAYYDAACTKIEDTIVWTATQNGDVTSGPATITLYSTNGTVTEVADAQLEFIVNSSNQITGISFLFTSITGDGKSQGELGVGCSVAGPSTQSCGVAIASNVYSSSVEDGANVSFTAATTSSGSTFTMQAAGYQSGIDGLTIAATSFPDWSVSPSSAQVGSVSVNGTQSGSTVSLTVTDSTNGGTVAISGSEAGTLTGSVTRSDTGASVATFTVDAYGNGTVTYGNGSQVPIVNYAVQG